MTNEYRQITAEDNATVVRHGAKATDEKDHQYGWSIGRIGGGHQTHRFAITFVEQSQQITIVSIISCCGSRRFGSSRRLTFAPSVTCKRCEAQTRK